MAFTLLAACGTEIPDTAQCDGTAEVLYRGHVWSANLAVADGTVYFTTFDDSTSNDPHTVMAISTTCGARARTVWNTGSQQLFGSGMAVRGGRVIWAQSEAETGPMGIYASPTTGGAPTLIGEIAHVAYYASFAADDDAVYTADGQNIMRIALDGSGAAAIGTPIPTDEELDWIEMRDTSLYYATALASTYVLYTLDTVSGTVTSFAAPTDYRGGQFDVDDTQFYLPTASGIELVDFSGTAHGHITSGGTDWTTVIRGPDGFYGSDGEGVLARMAFDGSTVETLQPPTTGTPTLVTDGTAVYATTCCADVYELPAAAQP